MLPFVPLCSVMAPVAALLTALNPPIDNAAKYDSPQSRARPTVQFAAAPNDLAFDVNEPVVLAIDLCVAEKSRVCIWDFNPKTSVAFRVTRNIAGEKADVALTQYAQLLRDQFAKTPNAFGSVGPVVSADEPLRLRYNLSRRFDLSLPGRYAVRAVLRARTQGDESDAAEIAVSDPVFIEVQESPPRGFTDADFDPENPELFQ